MEKGLSSKEAERRLDTEGLNQLPSDKQKSLLSILFLTLKEPMFLLLIISVAIYFILGDIKEASALMISICIIIGISFYQNQKTEKALSALKKLSEPQVLVIRDNIQQKIFSKELVVGDIMILSEGERVPADAKVISPVNLTVDESILTGESLTVSKTASQPIFSGTLITSGHTLAKVVATGSKSEIGKIGKTLLHINRGETKLQQETRKLILKMAVAGGFICLLVFMIYGLVRNNWLEGLLAGITLSMSLLPEEFAVILTVFLALGAWRIAKKKVLTKDAPAIEALGATTALCIDKTGTITFNQMTIELLYSQGKIIETAKNHELTKSVEDLIYYATLACRQNTFDPIEKAIFNFAKSLKILQKSDNNLKREYPFSKNMMAMTNVWQSEKSDKFLIAAKGAPETILDFCSLSFAEKQDILYQVRQMASGGLKVLAIAKGESSVKILPQTQAEINFRFLGLVGFSDPVRPSVNQAILQCYKAGIKVLMMTGDFPQTAQYIGTKIGLYNSEKVVTGREISKMNEEEIRNLLKTTTIFARITPEEKLKLINALKMNGEVVAMTGDGVNDAPALKSAQIGIALGGSSTDVAKEAASLILLDGDFSSLVEAIKLGRRVYNNLKRAIIYVLAIHVPIAGIALLPPLFNFPLILFPLHIVFLELVIDPSSSVAFETTEADIDLMSKPPRKLREHFLDNQVIFYSFLQGLIILLGCLALMFFSKRLGLSEDTTRTLAFITLITSNIGLMLINLNGPENIWQSIISSTATVRLIITATAMLLIATIMMPVLRDLFFFARLTTAEIIYYFVFSLIIVSFIETFEFLVSRKVKNIL